MFPSLPFSPTPRGDLRFFQKRTLSTQCAREAPVFLRRELLLLLLAVERLRAGHRRHRRPLQRRQPLLPLPLPLARLQLG